MAVALQYTRATPDRTETTDELRTVPGGSVGTTGTDGTTCAFADPGGL
jgi:hypothetical protein